MKGLENQKQIKTMSTKIKVPKTNLTFDDIDYLIGKEEQKLGEYMKLHNAALKRIQKKCPHNFDCIGADHLRQFLKCKVCGLETTR